MEEREIRRKPDWLKIQVSGAGSFSQVKRIVDNQQLHTVCQSARCPNIGECWARRTATFMILGNVCSRNCGFCAVASGKPGPLDPDEPSRVAEAVEALGLRYAVVTSVTRDDLPDGGAAHFAETIRAIKKLQPKCAIEVLIPDFQGSPTALQTVLDAKPDLLNHNLETVSELYKRVRPQASYQRSLELLWRARKHKMRTKSGLMLGLGEKRNQVQRAMRDLRAVDCLILTLGQYLQPSKQHLPVDRYVLPEEFSRLRHDGYAMGFEYVAAAPLVRSSYHAEEQLHTKNSETKTSMEKTAQETQ